MESALAWIGQIAEWLGQWIPRWIIIDPTWGAVKFVGGKRAVPLGAGIHFYWPARTSLKQYPTARQADALRSQVVVTTDDKVICAAGMIVYEVVDILKLLGQTYEASVSIKDISLACVHDVLCEHSWEDLKNGQRRGTLNTELRNSVKKQLEDYGVRVLKVQLTDLAPARVLKIHQATGKDEE